MYPDLPGYPDEDTVSGDTRMNPNDMGTIRVLVFLAESWRRHDDDSSRRYRIQDHPPATVDERAKKALEHCVSYVYSLSEGPEPSLRCCAALGTSNHTNPQHAIPRFMTLRNQIWCSSFAIARPPCSRRLGSSHRQNVKNHWLSIWTMKTPHHLQSVERPRTKMVLYNLCR